ncbi:hypothetical protein KIN20_036385, partial [Parelaphostrongylus tenuis]
MMTEYDREKVMESTQRVETYSCDLEGEAYQIAKANCELPKPPEPTYSSLGSNNYTLIRGRYNSNTGRAIPNYGVAANGPTTKVGCAYAVCDGDKNPDDPRIEFTCKYEEP